MSNMCLVCGYPGLSEPAYQATPKSGLGSLEICPCCGFQFGYTDDAKLNYSGPTSSFFDAQDEQCGYAVKNCAN